MSDSSTTRMLEAYIEQRTSPKLFLSSFFSTTPRSFHSSEFVEVDIRRMEPRLAIPVQSVNAGARQHEASKYTNKKFLPAVYQQEATISAWSTSQRRPGVDPFQDVSFRQAALDEAFRVMNEIEDMMRRGIELAIAQIFQLGVVTLKDDANQTIYTIDFEARASHFITTTPWAADGTTGDPLADLEAAGEVVRTHGKMPATDVILGKTARQRFFVNAKVRGQLDNLGMQRLQDINVENRPAGATYLGTIVAGNYRYRLWAYDDFYIDPVTSEVTPYVADNKVIMLAEQGRRILTFGSIPMFTPPDARAAQFLPARMSSVEQGFDMTTNVWVTPNGQHLKLFAGTRPLPVPVAIDTFACLTVA